MVCCKSNLWLQRFAGILIIIFSVLQYDVDDIVLITTVSFFSSCWQLLTYLCLPSSTSCWSFRGSWGFRWRGWRCPGTARWWRWCSLQGTRGSWSSGCRKWWSLDRKKLSKTRVGKTALKRVEKPGPRMLFSTIEWMCNQDYHKQQSKAVTRLKRRKV